MRSVLLTLVLLSLVVVVSSVFWALQYAAYLPQPSGYATNNQTGNISIIVLDNLAITANDADINFGTCVPNTTRGYTIVDSNLSSDQVNNDECIDGTFPDYFVVQNIGNIDANVTVRSNVTGQVFFNDTDSWLAYKTIPLNSTCLSSYQQNYTNFSAANTAYTACDRLDVFGAFQMSILAYINASVRRGGSVGLTFSAAIIS